MSEAEKIKETPKPTQQEQTKEPVAPKVSQSAFDKVMEQQKILQQSPIVQSKLADQSDTEQRVREVVKGQDHGDEKRKKDDRDDSGTREKAKQKEKGSETATKEAVARGGEKKGSGGGGGRGSGGGGKGDSGRDILQKQILAKKLADVRGLISNISHSAFASKLAQTRSAQQTLKPEQLQALVNQIVQSVRLGKNELGEAEIMLALREHFFKGLRLRFTSKGGKVSIRFETARRDMKNLFTAESKKIHAALEEKGIAVSEIKVT